MLSSSGFLISRFLPSSVAATSQVPLLVSPCFPHVSMLWISGLRPLSSSLLHSFLGDFIPSHGFTHYLYSYDVWTSISSMNSRLIPNFLLSISISVFKLTTLNPKLNSSLFYLKLTPPEVFPFSIKSNSILIVTQAKKISGSPLISLFIIPASNPSANVVSSTFKIRPAFDHFHCLCCHHPGQATTVTHLNHGTSAWTCGSLCSHTWPYSLSQQFHCL